MDKIKLTIDGYNKIAKHWDGTRRHGWSEVNQYIDIAILNFLKVNIENGYLKSNKEHSYLKNIKNFLSSNKKNRVNNVDPLEFVNILDLGCGNGRLIDFLKEKIYWNNINYIGIDPSEELINICKNRYTNIEFKINDGIKIPLDDNSVDIVISLAVLHHIPIEHQDKWLAEMYRVIKKYKNSKAILTVWIQDEKSYTEKNIAVNINEKSSDNIYFNKKKLEKSKTVHKKISDNEMMMGFAQYENIRYVYLFNEEELINLLIKNKFKVLEKHIDKRPNSSHKNLILILEPQI